MFWSVIIALGIGFVLQSWLSFRQQKNFAAEFIALRRRGRVCMGKFRGSLTQGAILMLGVDDEGTVLEGRLLRGVTVFSRFRDFPLYDGQRIDELDADVARERHGKSVAKAVTNAVENHRIITSGGVAPEPKTAVGKLFDKLPGPGTPKRTAAQPAIATPAKKTVVRRGQPSPVGS